MTEFSIYQINTDRDNNRVCFLGLDSLERFQHSKEVDPVLYDRVYDGKLDCNSLETIYEKFNIDHPADYKGRSLSVSDVVEIRESDTLNPGFYFVDSIGFKSISFDKSLCKEPVEAGSGKISVLLVEPNKYPKMIEIDDTLEAMQTVVGGDIEEYMPFEDEVAYAKNVLEGRVQNETLFALLFEPEESIQKQWATNNNVLAQGNPAALTLPTVWEDLLQRRQKAVEQESTRENFLCKHCNIIYQGAGTESYIPIDVVQACRVDDIQWAGCEVYLGVDLSMSNDNCAVAMVGLIGDRIAARVMGFIPADKVDEKTSLEKFDYRMAVRNGECIACGDRTVDYGTIENWVFDLEETYGVRVQGVAYAENVRTRYHQRCKVGNRKGKRYRQRNSLSFAFQCAGQRPAGRR